MTEQKPIATQYAQQGSALLVSLVMLLLLSLIAVAGMQTTIMQERMSSNLADRELAFQAAEAALRDAETMLRTNPPATINNKDGLYDVNSDNKPDWTGDTLVDGQGAITISNDLAGVASQPRYYVEQIDSFFPAGTNTEAGTPVPPVVFYRVTALGTGGNSDTHVVVSSVFRNQ